MQQEFLINVHGFAKDAQNAFDCRPIAMDDVAALLVAAASCSLVSSNALSICTRLVDRASVRQNSKNKNENYLDLCHQTTKVRDTFDFMAESGLNSVGHVPSRRTPSSTLETHTIGPCHLLAVRPITCRFSIGFGLHHVPLRLPLLLVLLLHIVVLLLFILRLRQCSINLFFLFLFILAFLSAFSSSSSPEWP